MRMLRGVWVPCWRDVARLAAARSGQGELGSFPACCVGSARQQDIANGRGKGGGSAQGIFLLQFGNFTHYSIYGLI